VELDLGAVAEGFVEGEVEGHCGATQLLLRLRRFADGRDNFVEAFDPGPRNELGSCFHVRGLVGVLWDQIGPLFYLYPPAPTDNQIYEVPANQFSPSPGTTQVLVSGCLLSRGGNPGIIPGWLLKNAPKQGSCREKGVLDLQGVWRRWSKLGLLFQESKVGVVVGSPKTGIKIWGQ